MSLGLNQYITEFCEFQVLFDVSGYFSCHSETVFPQKDFMMLNGDASKALIFSRLIYYKFNGLLTDFVKLFEKLFSSAFGALLIA